LTENAIDLAELLKRDQRLARAKEVFEKRMQDRGISMQVINAAFTLSDKLSG